jgi:hypothetical protein
VRQPTSATGSNSGRRSWLVAGRRSPRASPPVAAAARRPADSCSAWSSPASSRMTMVAAAAPCRPQVSCRRSVVYLWSSYDAFAGLQHRTASLVLHYIGLDRLNRERSRRGLIGAASPDQLRVGTKKTTGD